MSVFDLRTDSTDLLHVVKFKDFDTGCCCNFESSHSITCRMLPSLSYSANVRLADTSHVARRALNRSSVAPDRTRSTIMHYTRFARRCQCPCQLKASPQQVQRASSPDRTPSNLTRWQFRSRGSRAARHICIRGTPSVSTDPAAIACCQADRPQCARGFDASSLCFQRPRFGVLLRTSHFQTMSCEPRTASHEPLHWVASHRPRLRPCQSSASSAISTPPRSQVANASLPPCQ